MKSVFSQKPCDTCCVDSQVGNPYNWERECDRCIKLGQWKNEALIRLSKIEDILGDEYDLDRLKELVQANREGKVILRQIKEGSKVYIILLGRIFPFDVISAAWHSKNTVYEAEHGKYLRCTFNDADIGIFAFLTREEAEAALEKMKGGNE